MPWMPMTALGANPRSSVRRRDAAIAAHNPYGQRSEFPPDLVRRQALLDRLTALPGGSVALLVAPVGYGKSALLREWGAIERRRFITVRLTPDDDQPRQLLLTLAGALAPLDRELRELAADASQSRARRPTAALERRLLSLLGRPDLRCVLALDDAQMLRGAEAITLLGRLIDRLGAGTALALASRTALELPVARVRAERRLLDLSASELTLTPNEVARLAAISGLILDEAELELLVRRTEGWAAAVCLARLAVADCSQPARALARFGGDDRLVADYVREEVLAGLSPDTESFLLRTSVLDRLSGELCDYVLERGDSTDLLRQLVRTNVLLVPLDRTDREYRYNPLFAQALHAELQRRQPEALPGLHARASEWYEAQGQSDRAVEHATAAGEIERAGRLLWNAAPSLLGYGHCATLMHHLRAFSRWATAHWWSTTRARRCTPARQNWATARSRVGCSSWRPPSRTTRWRPSATRPHADTSSSTTPRPGVRLRASWKAPRGT
jgi:LuxR family maltose regulon positive regulatory protein